MRIKSKVDRIWQIERYTFNFPFRASRRQIWYICRKSKGYLHEFVGKGGYFYLTRYSKTIARLYSLAVLPRFRKQGVGAALMKIAHDKAREWGCDRIRLEVHIKNLNAIRFYKKLGYVKINRRNDYYALGYHALIMEKKLNA